ncbi:MAG TPA: DUF4412 domain-containing protein [Verrucomicrobiae bacterium]|nr:DUF4412 domain-containing protein [Verrucomicrobiae bacterium]
MKAWRVCVVAAVVAVAAVATSFGQRGVGGGARDFGSAYMAKIFGANQAFTATAAFSVTDAQHGTPMEMEASYAFLKGNLRTDVDTTSMKGGQMPPQAIAQIKQMGMDKAVNIYRSDKKQMYLMYPGLKSYAVISPPASSTDKPEAKEPKVDVTEIGKETVDGHPTIKNKVTFTADDGSQHEMTTWNATDLGNFPIKTEMQERGSTITTHFTNIKLTAPDASLFEPPSDYTKYGSIQEMMMGGMQRMMPPGAGGH